MAAATSERRGVARDLRLDGFVAAAAAPSAACSAVSGTATAAPCLASGGEHRSICADLHPITAEPSLAESFGAQASAPTHARRRTGWAWPFGSNRVRTRRVLVGYSQGAEQAYRLGVPFGSDGAEVLLRLVFDPCSSPRRIAPEGPDTSDPCRLDREPPCGSRCGAYTTAPPHVRVQCSAAQCGGA